MSRWDRVTELFERALALPAEARGKFLEEHCAGDAALQSEVESLLAAYTPARTFFDDLEAAVVAPSMGVLVGGSATLAPGTVLDAYEIEAAIGAGGMGVVYRAHDRRLHRTVALKFIAPELIHNGEARARLIREARAAAALDHPHICTIHAIEQAPDGRLFLVMPYYNGETLKQRLSRGALDVSTATWIAAEVAEGLAHAHRAGIIHRDIKPANVLLTDEGAVKILDFGIARLTGGAAATRSGVTIGTAAYMAPEQVRGESSDARADIWSLGVLLYEMSSGQRPFRGDSEAAVLYAVLEAEPEPIGLPSGLDRLLERMLSKDATLRPSEAAAVADVLRQFHAQQTAVSPVRTPEFPALLGRRARSMALGAVLVALLGFAALASSRMSADHTPESAGIAVLPFVVRGDAELDYLRDGMVHLLSTKLDGISDLRAVDPHALLAAFGSDQSTPDPAMGRAAAGRFGAQAFVLGTVLRLGTGIELSASLYAPGGELQATANAMAKQETDLSSAIDELVRELVAHRLTDAGARLAGIAAMTTRSLPALRSYLEGEHLLRTGHPAAAIAELQRAVQLDSTFGLAWYRLARAAGWIGPLELNQEAAARAVRYGGALPERTRALVSAYRVFRTGDPLEAERLYGRIFARYPEDMETLELLGETLFHNNPFFGRSTAEARQPLERALAMDPGNRELMVHLMDLAAKDGRKATLDSLTERYIATEPGSETPTALHAYAALRTLVLESPEAREGALSTLAAAGPDAIEDALVRVAPQLRDSELSDRLAAMLTDASHPADLRSIGHLHRAWFAIARGRWSAAETHWRNAGSPRSGWPLVHRVLAATLPHAPTSTAKLDSLRGSVAAWTPAAALEDGLHEGDLYNVRIYLLGLLDWRAGDNAGVARAIADLATPSSTASTAGTPGLASALASTLRALELWRAGRSVDALAALDQAQLRIPFHRRANSPLLEQHLNRFVRAEILRAMGAADANASDDDALRWYASLEDGYFHWGAPFLAPALLGSAEIHERNGRIEQAVAAYERFFTLWADAEPGVHTWLELARERLQRMRADMHP
jgi:serine/threonine protein kinase/tetratricopeptide (TPR) repeat protein